MAPFVRLTIQNGRVNQGSIGAYPLNLLHNIGAVMFSIWTAGGTGSAEANGYAETILSLFRYKTLDSAGAVVTSQAQAALIRFSPPELGFNGHPYISGRSDDPPHLMTTVTAPFVRYERD